jgi:hypothetical protein
MSSFLGLATKILRRPVSELASGSLALASDALVFASVGLMLTSVTSAVTSVVSSSSSVGGVVSSPPVQFQSTSILLKKVIKEIIFFITHICIILMYIIKICTASLFIVEVGKHMQ